MNQQQAWNKEYKDSQGVPTSTRIRPSSALKRFLKYIESHSLTSGKQIIDLGCGIGRNSLYLLDQGYDVTAVDFATHALQKLEKTVASHPRRSALVVKQMDLSKKFPFEDNSFDLALDSVTTMTLTPADWKTFESELRRVVKPGGLFLSWVLSRDDGVIQEHAPGQSTYTVDISGITDYYFTEKDLRALYKRWELLEIEEVRKSDVFYGRTYERRIWWAIFRNTK